MQPIELNAIPIFELLESKLDISDPIIKVGRAVGFRLVKTKGIIQGGETVTVRLTCRTKEEAEIVTRAIEGANIPII